MTSRSFPSTWLYSNILHTMKKLHVGKLKIYLFCTRKWKKGCFFGLLASITRMHSSRMRTVRSSSRLCQEGSASVHAGIPTPPGPGTPLVQTPPPRAGVCQNITFATSLRTVKIQSRRSILVRSSEAILCISATTRLPHLLICGFCVMPIKTI